MEITRSSFRFKICLSFVAAIVLCGAYMFVGVQNGIESGFTRTGNTNFNVDANCYSGCTVSGYTDNTSTKVFGMVAPEVAHAETMSDGLESLYNDYNVDVTVTLGYIFDFFTGDAYDESTTDGRFSTWEFRSNGTDFMSRFTDLTSLVQTDFIVGTYRLLYEVKQALSQIEYELVNPDGLLNGIAGNTAGAFQQLEDIASSFNVSNTQLGILGNKIDSVNANLGTSITWTRAAVDRLDDLVDTMYDLLYVQNHPSVYYQWSTNTKLDAIKDAIENISITTGSTNLTPVTSRLDTIIALLAFEQADVLQSLIGDFDELSFAADVAELAAQLQNVFPFCLLYAAADVVNLLDVETVAPSWDFHIPYMGQQVAFGLDMTDFDGLRNFSAFICYVAMVLTLVFGTRKVLFGGGAR